MRKITSSKQFDKDWRKLSNKKIAQSREWLEIMDCLANDKPMSVARKNHSLVDDWEGFMECHIKFDLLLIYAVDDEVVRLHRIGSHSELFGHKNKNLKRKK